MLILIMRNMANNTMYIVQEFHVFVFNGIAFTVLKIISSPSIFSLHSSTSLLTTLFLHLQYLWSKYCFMSHGSSHSHSQLIGLKINYLSHIPFSINYLHSHPHLSSFHLCLLLQTLAYNLHLHLQVSCHSMCLVSLVLDIKLNTLTFLFLTTSGTHNLAYESLIVLQLTLHLFFLIL